ncbi:MAG: hypothetical protein J6Y78_10800 [Paludibacteraceae bacterium]|nr:hypothetical protein [Paludibacteraceae bacterium]
MNVEYDDGTMIVGGCAFNFNTLYHNLDGVRYSMLTDIEQWIDALLECDQNAKPTVLNGELHDINALKFDNLLVTILCDEENYDTHCKTVGELVDALKKYSDKGAKYLDVLFDDFFGTNLEHISDEIYDYDDNVVENNVSFVTFTHILRWY